MNTIVYFCYDQYNNMSLDKESFLEKYNISEEVFEKTNINFDDLLAIQADFKQKSNDYDDAGAGVVRKLLKFKSVHSVRYRIKDSEHLLEKIIRHRIKNPESDIVTVDNYEEIFTDLIGIRILHLFKSDWTYVHQDIINNYNLVKKAVANYRKGDPDKLIELYKETDCDVNEHPAGYRSVHYLINTSPTKKIYVAEIQVRTIFEEGWGEIDHTVRYPYYMNNPLLNEFSQLLNRLAGSADEMGEFILVLKQNLIEYEMQRVESEAQLEKLNSLISELEVSNNEKARLNKQVNELFAKQKDSSSILNNAANPYTTIGGSYNSIFLNSLNPSDIVTGATSINSLSSIFNNTLRNNGLATASSIFGTNTSSLSSIFANTSNNLLPGSNTMNAIVGYSKNADFNTTLDSKDNPDEVNDD